MWVLLITWNNKSSPYTFSDPKFSWDFGFKEFARPAIGGEVIISAFYLMGPVFFLAFSMFGFVLQLGSVVTEKELKLREVL